MIDDSLLAEDQECLQCKGAVKLEWRRGTIMGFSCLECGFYFEVLASFIEDLSGFKSNAFMARVDFSNLSKNEYLKLFIKVKRIFNGYSNFDYACLQGQLDDGMKVVDLGYYSNDEIESLQEAAIQFGIVIDFVDVDNN